jgi:exonuclease, DNA polymerase III, epsilon subunit family
VGLSSHGIVARPAETRLSERAMEFLRAGPSDAKSLIEHVCQMPGAPLVVAEQMALALFAARPEFERAQDGRWSLAAEAEEGARVIVGASAVAAVLETPIPYDAAVERDELATLSYVVVDVETTGTSPWRGDRITEIAAIVVRDGVVAERFETLVNPERPIPPMITALTQINWEMVKDAPRFRDICDDLVRVLSGHVFVAHNVDFDWRFVSSEVHRASGQRLTGRGCAPCASRAACFRSYGAAGSTASPTTMAWRFSGVTARQATRSRRRTCCFACSTKRAVATAGAGTIFSAC